MTPYLLLADFIVAHIDAETLLSFRASDEMHNRFYTLLDKEKQGIATADELAEVAQFMQIEQILQVAKAKVRQHAVQS